jgi:hypothetical protein
MKKLLMILAVLSLGAMFLPVRSPAQDTNIHIYHGPTAPPQTTLPPLVRGPIAAGPFTGPPLYRGDYIVPDPGPAPSGGCFGRSGGCQGRTGGCQGRAYAPIAYAMVPVRTGDCQGRAGGCQGGAGCQGGMAYGYGGPIPYGAHRGDGTFATPSGRPAPPGVLPWNGPIVGSLRALSGYDPYRP